MARIYSTSSPSPLHKGSTERERERRNEQLDNALCQHGVRYFLEASNICTGNIIAFTVIFLGRTIDVFKDIGHDRVEAIIGVLKGPGVAGCVLLHFQRGGSNAASIGGLSRREVDLGFLEDVDRLWAPDL